MTFFPLQNTMLRLLILLPLACLSSCVSTQTHVDAQPLIRENIEWARVWIPNANKDDKPRVLIVGDSITVGYFPGVETRLEDIAYAARLSTSRCVGDPVFFDELILVLKQYSFDVIHFNNGLHGFGYTEEQYKNGLIATMNVLDEYASGSKLIWAHSTPMRDSENLDAFASNNARVTERNAIAASIMAPLDIPITDLYGATSDRPDFYSSDGVHFNDTGKEIQAELTANHIRSALAQ